MTWPWPWFNPHRSGCIGPHFDAILICFELPPPLPPGRFPSLISLVDCAPPVCMRTTWTSLKPRNLLVQRLSRYVLVIHLYHMSKPAESSFTEYVVHTVLSSSGSDLFICYSVLPGNAQDAPFCHMWWAAFSVFISVAVRGHTSALYRRVDRIIASYNLSFTFRLIHLFFHIFLIFPNTAVTFPIRTLTSFSQLPLCDM